MAARPDYGSWFYTQAIRNGVQIHYKETDEIICSVVQSLDPLFPHWLILDHEGRAVGVAVDSIQQMVMLADLVNKWIAKQ